MLSNMPQVLRRFIGTVIVAVGIAASVPAEALTIGFNGAYDPSQWTTTILGTPPLGGAVFSASHTMLTLTGGDSLTGCVGGIAGFPGPCEVNVTSKNPNNSFSFHWDYNTSDIGPGFDQFGLLLNGVHTVLSDLGGPLHQSGDVFIKANTQFGWYVNCTDCTGGAAIVNITQFTAAPEPASLMLLGLGLAALAAIRRLWA
jgi:PEP-CTERM motif